jgi:transcriptional regulator with XRE-family HTH domain
MHESVTQANRDLGARLAALREAAGFTQASVARRVGYSRSTVANAEAGRGAARHFWEMCEEVLGDESGLLGLFDQIKTLHRRHQEEAAVAVRHKREADRQRWRKGQARALADAGRGQVHDSPELPREDSPATRDHEPAMPVAGPGGASGRHRLPSWALFAPALEPCMVDRSTDLDTLISLLADAAEPAAATRVVSIVGPGGFGKTTLATQACHHSRVTGSFPEILWVEAGEHCRARRSAHLRSVRAPGRGTAPVF